MSTIVGVIAAFLLVAIAIILQKLRALRSNMPSPGWLWFSVASKKTLKDFMEYVEKNGATVVHGMVVRKVDTPIKMLLSAKSIAFITHLDIAQILLKDEEAYQKTADGIGDVAGLLAESLVVSNGEKWRTTKEILGPAFHYDYVKKMVPIFVGKAEELFDTWRKNGKDQDMRPAMSQFTLDSLGMAAFNINFNTIHGGSHDYLKAYEFLFRPNPNKTKQQITKVVEELSEIDSLTEIQRTCRDEVDNVLHGNIPDAESVKSLTYLDMFIKEVLRHRPPLANITTRVSTKDSELGGYAIPKDTIMGVFIYAIHHLQEFWPDPDKFDPLRFLPENSIDRHPFAYMPFLLGRRNCIGNLFSLLEQKLFLAMALQRFTFEKGEGCDFHPTPTWRACRPVNPRISTIPRVNEQGSN